MDTSQRDDMPNKMGKDSHGHLGAERNIDHLFAHPTTNSACGFLCPKIGIAKNKGYGDPDRRVDVPIVQRPASPFWFGG